MDLKMKEIHSKCWRNTSNTENNPKNEGIDPKKLEIGLKKLENNPKTTGFCPKKEENPPKKLEINTKTRKSTLKSGNAPQQAGEQH